MRGGKCRPMRNKKNAIVKMHMRDCARRELCVIGCSLLLRCLAQWSMTLQHLSFLLVHRRRYWSDLVRCPYCPRLRSVPRVLVDLCACRPHPPSVSTQSVLRALMSEERVRVRIRSVWMRVERQSSRPPPARMRMKEGQRQGRGPRVGQRVRQRVVEQPRLVVARLRAPVLVPAHAAAVVVVVASVLLQSPSF